MCGGHGTVWSGCGIVYGGHGTSSTTELTLHPFRTCESVVGVAQSVVGVAQCVVGVAPSVVGVAQSGVGVAQSVVGMAQSMVGVALIQLWRLHYTHVSLVGMAQSVMGVAQSVMSVVQAVVGVTRSVMGVAQSVVGRRNKHADGGEIYGAHGSSLYLMTGTRDVTTCVQT